MLIYMILGLLKLSHKHINIYLLLYVNDMILMFKDYGEIHELKKYSWVLSSTWKIIFTSKIGKILVVDVKRGS